MEQKSPQSVARVSLPSAHNLKLIHAGRTPSLTVCFRNVALLRAI
jgi:hypothetical protein